MEIYVVGGSIRDLLLNREPKDVDYVVINSSPAEMISSGFHQVGSDFPVYLHPITGEEYALGRTESKIGKGYHGFECRTEKVSLFQDLSRRDLTINALAVKLEDYETFKLTKCKSLVIDYFEGIKHLEDGLLKHINECFKLDPVRVMRTARFVARYGFKINDDTMELMKKVAPELNHVSTERIWAEFAKGLMEKYPIKMMKALEQCASDVDVLQPFMRFNESALERCDDSIPLEARFVLVGYNFTPEDYPKLSIPNDCSKINELYHQVNQMIWNYDVLPNTDKLNLFTLTRAFNDDANLEMIFKAISVHNLFQKIHIDLDEIRNDLKKLKTLDLAEITKGIKGGKEIADAVFNARLAILEKIREV